MARSSARKAISLFASAGIGDLGLARHAVDVMVANELLEDRSKLYRHNHRSTQMFQGDIWAHQEIIVNATIEALDDEELFLVYATPPCQGMSTNGAGKLMAEVSAGNRAEEDPRNRLIIPAMEIIAQLRPRWVLLENVPGMQFTKIRIEGGDVNILDYVAVRLGNDYVGRGELVACSDHGIPQLRRRLITIFTRDEGGIEYFRRNGGTFFPAGEKVTAPSLRDAIGHFPRLDAQEGQNAAPAFHPLHTVNVMAAEKYWWVSHTAQGDTAFNNQCANADCRYAGNARHIDTQANGRWHASKVTPIYCSRCGALLPRPTVIDKATGQRRLISGFHSAYRRMEWDKPSRALTSNYPFEASDNKIHPEQNRVLSTYEALVIQTIADYDYEWVLEGGKPASKTLIAHVIGESVPPRLIDHIVGRIVSISDGRP